MFEITIHEINEETFSASIELSMYEIEVEGNVWTDEMENLWGDQVSSISTIAYFDSITSMEVFTKNGHEVQVITLELANFVKKKLDEFMTQEEIEVHNHKCYVDYSPQYYDLI